MQLRVIILAGALVATALTAMPTASAGPCGEWGIGELVDCIRCLVNQHSGCTNCHPSQLPECLPKHLQE